MAPKIEGVVNSTIGEGSVFQGKFFVQGSFQINGKFEGEIRTEEHLLVGETGKVKTQVLRAKKITVAGVVLGHIEAQEEVRLLSTGRVLGNISAPQITIEPGVVVKGQLHLTAGQKKDVDKLIEDAYNSGPNINLENMFVENKRSEELKVKEEIK
jgi:cytoskeletal protein CcmA (bactofilin family)